MGDGEDKAEQFAELSYEDSYRQLQEVLERLEAADLPLAESLDLYESGMKLAARCGKLLEEAELRVRKWQPDGTLVEFGADQEQ
ncbi:MAG: exodeoxyribonuclease VII small subunit [Caldilineaceae bacterium]|nr:exodeoxyribonuclease VII small subunit [Caldilineaceae bacterium]MCY4089953.1 exodeoxyribonuclease VII small subunit [Caldilineaceae bacterium]